MDLFNLFKTSILALAYVGRAFGVLIQPFLDT
jgi:hypothetical protein